MRRIAIALHLTLLAACVDRAPDPDAPADIRAMLETSAAAWNAGDLAGFMASYAPDESVTFVGHRELLHGWDAIRANYASFFEPGATRDSLRFEDMEIRAISDRHAIGYARWVLYGRERAPLSGPFTLVVERRDDRWVILHDHSSSED